MGMRSTHKPSDYWSTPAQGIPDFESIFRKSTATKSPLTTEARIYIHLLATSYHLTNREIQAKLTTEYQQTISLSTIKRYAKQ